MFCSHQREGENGMKLWMTEIESATEVGVFFKCDRRCGDNLNQRKARREKLVKFAVLWWNVSIPFPSSRTVRIEAED